MALTPESQLADCLRAYLLSTHVGRKEIRDQASSITQYSALKRKYLACLVPTELLASPYPLKCCTYQRGVWLV